MTGLEKWNEYAQLVVPEATALPAVPKRVEPLQRVKLLKAAFTVAVAATKSITLTSVSFTFSTFAVSVKRKAASALPVEPMTI